MCQVIYKICGTPTHDNWPGHTEMPWYSMFRPPKFIDRSLRQHIRSGNSLAVNLLDQLLQFDPSVQHHTRPPCPSASKSTDPTSSLTTLASPNAI